MTRAVPAWAAMALIVVAGLAAYSNSLRGEFFEYDDVESIRDNPHIRRLWPPSEALSLPLWDTGATVDARPVLSLSFALNHALFGPAPWGFHVVNVAIHIAAGLLLFGIVWRTIEGLPIEDCRLKIWPKPDGVGKLSVKSAIVNRQSSIAIALSIALLWVVHPLHTEAVTYTVQRAASMAGMFYLLTLYCAIRGFAAEEKCSVSSVQCSGGKEEMSAPLSLNTEHRILITGARRRWYAAAVLSCVLGAGTKQTIVSAPLIMFLYDGVFVSGSYTLAWRRHRRFYAALLSSWIILAGLAWHARHDIAMTHEQAGTLGYALTQPGVILRYLRLSIWPSDLVFDYTNRYARTLVEIVPPALALAVPAAGGAVALWRRHWLGFVAAWFFAILAPSSSVVVTQNVINEHHVYLPLVAVLACVVVGTATFLQRCVAPLTGRRTAQVAAVALVSAAVGVLALRTYDRNRDWRNALVYWTDNVTKRPQSATAHNNLGKVLLERGEIEQAKLHFRAALAISPHNVNARFNLGLAQLAGGRTGRARESFRKAVERNPSSADAHYFLGLALLKERNDGDAVPVLRRAVELGAGQPARDLLKQVEEARRAALHDAAANEHAEGGDLPLAIAEWTEVLKLRPRHAATHFNIGAAWLQSGDPARAIEFFEKALAIDPDSVRAREELAKARRVLERRSGLRLPRRSPRAKAGGQAGD